MGIWSRKCAVEKCNDSDSPRDRFPMPNKYFGKFKKWLEATGNTNIVNLDPELVYKSYRICDRHFTPENKYTNNHLKENAIPTLFCIVPGNKDIENEGNTQVSDNKADINIPNESSSVTDHLYALNSVVNEGPSTSIISDHTYALTSILTTELSMQATDIHTSNQKTANELTALTTDQQINLEINNMPSTSGQNKNMLDSYASTELETPTTSRNPRKRKLGTMQEDGEENCDLNSQKKIACKKTINLEIIDMPSTSKQHTNVPDNYSYTNIESETPRTCRNPRKRKRSFNIL